MNEPHLSAAAPGTAQPPGALGPEDFQQLYALSMSADQSARDQASMLAKKLTPAEASGFVAYQKSQHPQGDIGRTDNSMLGMPPEAIAAMGVPVLRALFGPGLTATARAVAGTKAAVAATTPVLKYEAVKTGLQAMHVPTWAAVPLAYWVSGYRGNGKTLSPAEEVPPTAEGYDRYMPNVSGTSSGTPAADVEIPPAPRMAKSATSPVEAAPVSTAPSAASSTPAPPATAPKFPTQKALNELAMQARRQGVKLSEQESLAGVNVMRDQDASAEDVVKTIAAARSPSGLTLSAEEQAQAATLRAAGKSGAQIEDAILQARKLAKRLKTPPTGAVQDAVARRNKTGRWESDE